MNHFLEYDLGDTTQAFTIHTGSRNLGQKVWKHWNKIANSNKISKEGEKKIIKEVKAANTDKSKLADEIKAAVEEYKLTLHPGFLAGENMRAYLTDIVICSAYAKWNHKVIQEKVAEIHNKLTGSKVVKVIDTRHNYIDFDTVDGIPMIRKGAVRANEGEEFILPFNMRDGLAICTGLGNPDWNYSLGHGAGRIMSRGKAKDSIKMKDFEEAMKGIYSTTVNRSTIDEAPQAYKDTQEIIENIKPNCSILFFMKPVINLKAGEDDSIPQPWRNK